jgi:hypothetical protein
MRRVWRTGSLLAALFAASLFSTTCAPRRSEVSTAPTESEPPGENEPSEESEETNPLGANAACYVCHIPFVKEELSKVHLQEKITCIRCHGLSAGHANDEDIGATPPDKSYERGQVNAFCRTCHREHDVPPEQVIERWLARRGSESAESMPVCTDCHGTHRIAETEL